MKSFLFSIGLSIIALGVASAAFLQHEQVQSFGATANAGANALYEQSLAQPLGTTDANMYVTSGGDVQGNLLPLNSYQCLSVDTGQPNFEAICGNVTASASSGLTLAVTLRGLSTQTATTSNPSFIFTHRRGADVRITDFPALTVVNNQLNGVQTIPNPIYYSSNFTPPFWTNAASNTIATLGIVQSTAAAGCGNASETASGCSQISTAAQAAAGVSIGSTAARLVLPGSLATSTPGNSTATGNIPTTIGKFLSQSFFDFTQLFTFSGGLTSTATTTLAGSNVLSNAVVIRSVPYAFPSSQGASSTVLSDDGLGNLSWEGQNWQLLVSTTTTQDMKYATTTFPGVAHLKVFVNLTGISGGSDVQFFFNNDVGNNYAAESSFDFGAPAKNSTFGTLFLDIIGSTSPRFVTADIVNNATLPKRLSWTETMNSSAALAPGMVIGSGLWNNTSNPITTLTLSCANSNCNSGTHIDIYGSNF